MIITHRGLNTGAKENTLAAFMTAVRLGASGIECDLRLTQDGRVVVHHDNRISLLGKRFTISRTPRTTLLAAREEGPERLLTLEELLDFVRAQRLNALLEVKSASPVLAEAVAQAVGQRELWDTVHLMGFSIFMRSALRIQPKYPKLRVVQFLEVPLFTYLKKPSPSYGVILGWVDGMFGSKPLFTSLVTPKRLLALRQRYEQAGFKVFGGILNSPAALDLFSDAGIVDIVTDNVPGAVVYVNGAHAAPGAKHP